MLSNSPHARCRLFCFPYAGGGASIYRTWRAELGPSVDVRALQLPGRESRIAERPLVSVPEIAEKLAQEITPSADLPFVLLGYSLGALLAFEVARLLRRRGILPTRLIVCALGAPHLPRRGRRIHALPAAEFLAEVQSMNGTPEQVIHNPELMQLMLPALQADFRAYETYRYEPQPPLDCPISAMGGAADRSVTQCELAAWSEHTTGGFRMRMLDGDHFFLNSSRAPLLWAVRNDLPAPERIAC